jgi:hypothetical protein
MIAPFQPNEEEAGPMDWLQREQRLLADSFNEPPLITIRLIHNGFYEVELSTFSDYHGIGGGWSLHEAVAQAVDCLLAQGELALDEFAHAQYRQAKANAPLETW